MNKCVYLPKMVPLKWALRDLGVFLGVRGVWAGKMEWKVMGGSPTWDIFTNTEADYRNHRRFTLRRIKVGITPVSCNLKIPFNSRKSYHIIYKAENQLMYETVRNISKILYMYENQRLECYT